MSLNLFSRIKTSNLLRDATHLSIGNSLRLIIQAGYFVLLARSLGPDAYGAFVSVVAMAGILGPFSGMGSPSLFIKNVRSGKREAAVCWAAAPAASPSRAARSGARQIVTLIVFRSY